MEIFKPHRVSHRYEQRIKGRPEQIFPLYCPVRETLWCNGWDPVAVYTESGVAEPDCVFVTRDGQGLSAWYVTVHDADLGRVEMIKHTPETVMSKLEIQIEPLAPDQTRALITYTLTALGPEGDKVLEAFTRESYETAMQAWEKAMNHYLATGELLTGLPRF